MKLDTKYGKTKEGGIPTPWLPFGLLQFWVKMIEGGKHKATGKDVIGIVYVDGAILPGKPDPSPFGGDSSGYAYKHAHPQGTR